MVKITIGSATDPGKEKNINQDYHAYHIPNGGPNHKKGVLLAIADGMGGHGGGEVASKITVDTLIETYYNDTSDSITESLNKSFLKTNEEIIAKQLENIDLARMGATLVAVVIRKTDIYYAHAGDSRGYLIFGNEISQFTEDHSFVASLVKAGVITEEEALTHPERHVITKAIGLSSELTVEASQIDRHIEENLYILLCCDGLTGVVSDEEISSAVNQYREPDVISEKLVAKANESGGPDNITVLIAKVDKVDLISSFTDKLKDLVR